MSEGLLFIHIHIAVTILLACLTICHLVYCEHMSICWNHKAHVNNATCELMLIEHAGTCTDAFAKLFCSVTSHALQSRGMNLIRAPTLVNQLHIT
jgi:hypothetical protein